jgi:hypothetical protein
VCYQAQCQLPDGGKVKSLIFHHGMWDSWKLFRSLMAGQPRCGKVILEVEKQIDFGDGGNIAAKCPGNLNR